MSKRWSLGTIIGPRLATSPERAVVEEVVELWAISMVDEFDENKDFSAKLDVRSPPTGTRWQLASQAPINFALIVKAGTLTIHVTD